MRNIFYCDNGGERSAEYQAAFRRVVNLSGARGLAYSGLSTNTRQSNLDQEIRADFYGSDLAIVLFTRSPRDSWALAEIDVAGALGRNLLIFATAELAEHETTSLGNFIAVKAPEEFERALRHRIELNASSPQSNG